MVGKRIIGRFDWERAVIGRNGPRSATRRLVLLVLASHVPRGKAHAWPSIRTLEAETALSNRSVIDQLEAAVNEGWLKREFTRLPNMRYRGNVYHLTVPVGGEPDSPVQGAASGEARSPVQPTYPQPGASGERGAATGERGAATGERDDGQLVNVVPGTTLFNRKENRFDEQKGGINPGVRTGKPNGKSAEQWADELGLVQGAGEHKGAFHARVLLAVREHNARQRSTEGAA